MNWNTHQGLFNQHPFSLFVICVDFDDDSDVEVDNDSDERNRQEGTKYTVFCFLLKIALFIQKNNNSYIILLHVLTLKYYISVYSLCSQYTILTISGDEAKVKIIITKNHLITIFCYIYCNQSVNYTHWMSFATSRIHCVQPYYPCLFQLQLLNFEASELQSF